MDLNKCRLCLDNAEEYLDINYKLGFKNNLWEIIKLHFNLLIESNKVDSRKICESCWEKTESFHNFYLNVKAVQENYTLQQERLEENNIPDLLIKIETNDVVTDDDEIPLAKVIENEKFRQKIVRVDNKRKIGTKEISEVTDLLCENDEYETEESKEQENEQIRQFFTMECDLCSSEKFTNFNEVKNHYLNQHEIAKGYLICCKRKFKSLSMIREHILWHTNPEVFTCKLCNKLYVNKSGLDNHKLSHEPEENRPHKCDVCDKSFAKFNQMKQHKLNHAFSSMDKKFKCDTCGNGFPKQSLLRTHNRVVHEGIYSQTFICDICAKVFKSKIMFNRHRNEDHLGIKTPKIQCQLCGAWIKSERYLRRHMIRHEDEAKEFICKYCGKKAPNREALRKHERYVHILEPKFKCTYCDKIFKRSVWLKEHLTMHTGEILYTCMFCTKTSNSNANMNSHKLKVHKIEWEKYKIDNKL